MHPGRLTALDWGAIAMPAVLPGRDSDVESAVSAFVRSGPAIARATGIGIAGLHKLAARDAHALADALRAGGTPCDLRPFNRRWFLRMADGVDAYLAGRSPKTRKGLRRSLRLLREAVGGTLEVEMLCAKECPDGALLRAFEAVFALRAANPAKCSDARAAGAFRRFYEGVQRDWSARGWLTVVVMHGGGSRSRLKSLFVRPKVPRCSS